ncbi:helix-turn-helix transcriptional regulator [Pseudoduganella umbonata]|nr:helix-turn-helix transcriptional regulator [Pseudoduganella umbonata]
MMLEMYELAEHSACADYPDACLGVIGKTVRFDIAAFGCGAAQDRRTACRGGPVADCGALSSSFHLNLPAPVICSPARLQLFFDPGRLLGYALRHRVRHLLLIGSAEPVQCPVHWLLVARRGRRAFSAAAADYLAAAWPHVLRCQRIHQQRYLAAQAAGCARAAFALVSPEGIVEAADGAFERMAGREWPGWQAGRLPPAALDSLRRLGRHDGRIAHWSLANGPAEAFLCRGVERTPVDLLTPAECVAARYYAQGRTHGEIAALLGVTSNTVRTHLAHVYSKLDIHRKSELPAQLR